MYSRKIQKQIRDLRVPPLPAPPRVPVLLSDSKGLRLQNQISGSPASYIRFWCQSGADSANRLQYLRDNLAHELQTLGNITLYVWVGTCDLTDKQGNFISLAAQDNTRVNQLTTNLREIYHFTRQFGDSVKLVFLHLPVYSIYHWNLAHNYQGNTEQFKNDDYKLNLQVSDVNFFIEDTNRLLHANTPKFSLDLTKPRSRQSSPIVYSLNFKLYSDGVHATNELATLWLVRLCRLIRDDCY